MNMGGYRVANVADPLAATDATNKQYVDNLAAGIDAKASVYVATTGNVNIAGAALGTIDGVSMSAGGATKRVLVKSQTNPAENGIYMHTVPDGWSRASDADTWTELVSAFVFVEQGNTFKDTGWLCLADQGGTLGTTSNLWTQFSAAAPLVDGDGLLKTGNQLDVQVDGSTLEITADRLNVKAGGITSLEIGNGAINLSGATPVGPSDVIGVLPIATGGTGQGTAKAARESGLGSAGYYSSAVHGAGTTIAITQATHGLRASRGLLVQVQDETTGNVEIPDVSVAATGDVTVTFGVAVTANSKRVTVIG